MLHAIPNIRTLGGNIALELLRPQIFEHGLGFVDGLGVVPEDCGDLDAAPA